MRNYRNTGAGHATICIPDKERFFAIVASGTAFRIDPVYSLQCPSPSESLYSAPPRISASAPTVGVVDGGLHAQSYRGAEAWRTSPLVVDTDSARQHGNDVSSLAVHAHVLNPDRRLPELECRIGTVQAIPDSRSARVVTDAEFVDYLDKVIRTNPETKIWNISANQIGTNLNHDEVSILGHELARIARERGVLPVVSIGNLDTNGSARPSPPADCEAAVVVGGRQADSNGYPAEPCSVCRVGPGPDGMLKPDVSWFSELKTMGGVKRGSSYSTPLVSGLAGHTYAALRDPTPDLVKALLIHGAELDEHDPALGWGTPYQGHMPWLCAPGSVTLAWCASLSPGTAYYWSDIPIPPELVRNGMLFGKARLTAVLAPIVSPFGGANYFASRLETSLQYVDRRGVDWKPLVGSMRESTIPENVARNDLKKWHPIRRLSADFSKRKGRTFSGRHFRLYARVYTRDIYQFGWNHPALAGPQHAAFVLTFWSGEQLPSIYDSTVQALGTFVESAVNAQDIVQDVEN